uniref:taste receptor type 2 member 14-like n=1 Tax=Jaculus jaculus TaxID=51337 RepID=UPI001E1B1D05|nr:taste receptor type 2 member 14-like [Jaculus jaculus]
MVSVSWTLTSHINIWLATSLSIVYFLKIAIFSNSLFLYLKWRCEKVIYMALLVSLVALFANTILTYIRIDVLIEGPMGNTSYMSSERIFIQYSKLLLFPNFMFLFAPFGVSLIAFLLLFFSLWKHRNKIQHSGQGGRDARTTAHVKALQSVTVFLLLYISFFLSLATQVWTFEMEASLIIMFGKATLTVFPCGHSCVLILGNNKLRQALFSVLQGLRHRLEDAEPSGL